LLTITAGEPKEVNYWSGKVTLGANIREGNTNQTEYNGSARFLRRTVRDRVAIDYIGNYNVTDDELQANNHRASAGWDKFINDKLFVKPAFGEYFKDPFQNIGSRWTFGVGVGYQIYDTPKTDWEVSGGPAYQRTDFDSVVPGDPESEETPALLIGTTLDMELTKSIDFYYTYSFQIVNEQSGSYNHHMVTAFEFEITSLLDFDIQWVWDRIEDPRQNSDGSFPESDDFRLIVGIGFDF
jgi:putative salt-induced outer membrane protein YdiY